MRANWGQRHYLFYNNRQIYNVISIAIATILFVLYLMALTLLYIKPGALSYFRSMDNLCPWNAYFVKEIRAHNNSPLNIDFMLLFNSIVFLFWGVFLAIIFIRELFFVETYSIAVTSQRYIGMALLIVAGYFAVSTGISSSDTPFVGSSWLPNVYDDGATTALKELIVISICAWTVMFMLTYVLNYLKILLSRMTARFTPG